MWASGTARRPPARGACAAALCSRSAPLLLLLLACTAATATPVFSCAPGNNATQCAALGALYSATGGPGWVNSSGWAAAAAGQPTDFCTFAGVACAWTRVATPLPFIARGTRNASLPGAVAYPLQVQPGLTYALATCGAPSSGSSLLRVLVDKGTGSTEVANSEDAQEAACAAPCPKPAGVRLVFSVAASASPTWRWMLLAGCDADGACSGNVSMWAKDFSRVLPQTPAITVLRLCVFHSCCSAAHACSDLR